jgi:predicted flap endonuclease-1-like 5' DNA nuclease
MFDGVGWAAAEIVIFMLIATLIGLTIGWIFGRYLQKGTIAPGYEADLAAQRELIKKAESRVGESHKDLERASLELKGEQAKVAELTAEIEEAKAAVGDSEATLADLEQKDAEIAALRAELSGMGDLQASAAATADLEIEVASLREEHASRAGERDKMAAQITELEDDLAAAGGDAAALQDRVALLEGDLASRDAEIARLEAELRAVPEPSAAPVLAPGADPEPEPQPEPEVDVVAVEPTKEEGLAKISEIAERTAGGVPVADDDLKMVRGIGPKLERTLKGLGITSFRQIANFETEDIVFVTAALNAFKGRIERDDWMSSAAEQHARKYDEPV